MKKEQLPVKVIQQLSSSKEVVWEVLTNPSHMQKWFFEQIKEFKPVLGFETCFVVSVEDRAYPHRWKIIEVINNQKIVYDWSYDGYQGKGLVTFELDTNPQGTLITLTNIVVESFQENIPEFSRKMCQQGWEYFIQNRLKDYVEKEISS